MKIRGHHLRNVEDLRRKYPPTNYSEFYSHISSISLKDMSYKRNRVDKYIAGIYQRIIEEPHLMIKIIDYLDGICFTCGENDGTNCTNRAEKESELRLKDRKIGDKLGLCIGETYTSEDILFRFDKDIFN